MFQRMLVKDLLVIWVSMNLGVVSMHTTSANILCIMGSSLYSNLLAVSLTSRAWCLYLVSYKLLPFLPRYLGILSRCLHLHFWVVPDNVGTEVVVVLLYSIPGLVWSGIVWSVNCAQVGFWFVGFNVNMVLRSSYTKTTEMERASLISRTTFPRANNFVANHFKGNKSSLNNDYSHKYSHNNKCNTYNRYANMVSYELYAKQIRASIGSLLLFIRMLCMHLVTYPCPDNLGFVWNMGFLLFLTVVTQIVSGMLLALHYTSDINHSYYSVMQIVDEVLFGWCLRYMHSSGASSAFGVCYGHIGRGLHVSSYVYNNNLWLSGLLLLVFLMAIAFLGYVLTWGQMSFWGGTVITNLL